MNSPVISHPVMRYHGGKFRIPAHVTYVEPFGGAASVLLSKQPSQIEVYNDVDCEVVNLFHVLRDPAQRAKLEEAIYFTPYSRQEFLDAYQDTDCNVERARRMIVRAQQGFGSAGATKGGTGFRRLGGRNKNYEVRLWANYSERLQQCAERLKSVVIENQDFATVINQYDGAETLFFVDPPYVESTRTSNVQAYRHEMTDDQHIALIEQLHNVDGMVVLSGYDSDLYNSRLADWYKVTRSVQASGQNGGVCRTECLWISQAAQVHDLFGGVL